MNPWTKNRKDRFNKNCATNYLPCAIVTDLVMLIALVIVLSLCSFNEYQNFSLSLSCLGFIEIFKWISCVEVCHWLLRSPGVHWQFRANLHRRRHRRQKVNFVSKASRKSTFLKNVLIFYLYFISTACKAWFCTQFYAYFLLMWYISKFYPKAWIDLFSKLYFLPWKATRLAGHYCSE